MLSVKGIGLAAALVLTSCGDLRGQAMHVAAAEACAPSAPDVSSLGLSTGMPRSLGANRTGAHGGPLTSSN